MAKALDGRYADRRDRVRFTDEIDAMIEAWTEKRTKHEVMEILGAAGVPCGAVLDWSEVLANEHLRQRGFVVDLEHPQRGKFPMPGNPVRMSESPKAFGLSEADLATLGRDGVI